MTGIIQRVAMKVDGIFGRRNQPTSEHGQATIAFALLAVADSLADVASAIREGRSK